MDQLLNLGVSAREQMAWQERLANTAHVREINDLKAAGLNPVLSAGGKGADTPSGANDLSEMMKIAQSSISSSGKAVNNLVDKLPSIIKSATENIAKETGFRKFNDLGSALTEMDEYARKGLYWNGKEYAPDTYIDIGADNDAGLAMLFGLASSLSGHGDSRMSNAMRSVTGKVRKGTFRQAIQNLSSTKNAYGYKRQMENLADLWLTGL